MQEALNSRAYAIYRTYFSAFMIKPYNLFFLNNSAHSEPI